MTITVQTLQTLELDKTVISRSAKRLDREPDQRLGPSSIEDRPLLFERLEEIAKHFLRAFWSLSSPDSASAVVQITPPPQIELQFA